MAHKILISAYACAPGEGSEPEVGWQWALQMARFHDVTVLTRTNNRPAIESGLAALPPTQPKPSFVYHDAGSSLLKFKARFKAVRVYYQFWQRSAWLVVSKLHREQRFDLMHHLTFATFRYATAVWGHGATVIWGPVGGIESIPFHLLPWRHPTSLLHEVIRNTSNALQSALNFKLLSRARASSLILATTREMQEHFQRLGAQSRLMPTIGLDTKTLPFRERTSEPAASNANPAPPTLSLLFVGNILGLKGIDLAIDALKLSGVDATLTIVGSGNYLEPLKSQAANLGLQTIVHFTGRIPRQDMLRKYADYDTFVFPSLHDTGGFAVIEAMFNRLPVICLDCGGPAVAVRDGCGIRVPVRSRPQIVQDIAAAIQRYSTDRALLHTHGKTARQVVLDHYDWNKKGEEMDECYQMLIH